MRTRTLAVLVAVVAVLAALLVGGLLLTGSSGSLTESWVSDTPRDNERNHHPVGVGPNDDVVVASVMAVPGSDRTLTDTDCSLVRLAPTNGSVQWQAGVPAEDCFTHALTEPAIADLDGDGTLEVAVASTEDALTVRAAADGSEQFRVPLSNYGYGRPTVADIAPTPGREIVVSDIDGTVVAATANGTERWRVSLTDAFGESVFVWHEPLLSDIDADGETEIVIGTSQGFAVLSTDGEVLWTDESEAIDLAVANVDDDAAAEVIVSRSTTMTVVDGRTQERQWTQSLRQSVRLDTVTDADDDGTVELFVGLANGTALSMDAETGTTEWATTVSTADDAVLAPPVLARLGDAGPSLVLAGRDGTVSVLDTETGTERAAYERSVPIWTYPTPADIDDDGVEELLVRYGDGRVVALSFTQ